MAVLWCGGEDVDFPNGGPVSVANGYGRSGWARCAIQPASNPTPILGTLFPGGAVGSPLWLSCQWTWLSSGTPTAILVVFVNPNGTSGIGMLMVSVGANYQCKFGVATFSAGGSTVTQLGNSSPLNYDPTQRYRVDMQLLNYGSGSGTINLFLNGNQIVSYTGALTAGGGSTIGSVGCFNSSSQISEVIVANESTLGWPGLATLAPNGNGTTQQWTNPAYTNYNPVIINDANATYSNVVGQDNQATLTAGPSAGAPGTSFTVKVVKIIARCASPAVGSIAQDIKLGFNNGTTVGVGAAIPATTGYSNVEQYFTTDPTTGGAWGSLANYQLDLRSAASTTGPTMRATSSGSPAGSSITASFSPSSQPGDLGIVCMSQAFASSSLPSGWAVNLQYNGSPWSTVILSKILTSGDISSGVTVGWAGSWNAAYLTVTYAGPTSGIRETDGYSIAPLPQSVSTSGNVIATDGMAYFTTCRYNDGTISFLCTVNRGTMQQQLQAAASGCLYTENPQVTGVVTATFNGTPLNTMVGCFQGIVVVKM